MAFTYIIFTIMISYITPLMIINQIGSEIGYLFIKMIYILYIYIYKYRIKYVFVWNGIDFGVDYEFAIRICHIAS